MTATLTIQLLGDFRVLVRGRAVTEAEWSRRQAKLLIKLLALAPRYQLHREQLMAAIWPDLDADAAAANLHKVIHLARHALEPRLRSAANSQFILTSQQQVQLRAGDLSIDVAEFERLAALALQTGRTPDYEAALAVYRGDLLADDPYADWCSRKRDSLRARREQLAMNLGRLYAAAHQHQQAIAQFETLVASFSANEAAHRELMTLYVLGGRRSDALRQFRRCQDAVRAELDTEPEDVTLQLYRRIVSREIRALPRVEAALPSQDSTEAVAVLPFENETDDSEIDYLSPGIAESVIRNLSQVPGLRVLAFSTVSRYRRRAVDPRRLGRELEVFAVVTGRIRRLGDMLIVATELVDTSDGSRLWGAELRLPQTDVLAVQERISDEISAKLRERLSVAQRRLVVKRYTADPEAYRLYLKGRFHWNRRTAEGLTRGLDYFEKAIARDPSYALAYSGLADCYNLLSLYSVLPPRDTMPKAKAAANTALEIDPSLAEAHTSLAYTYLYYDWDWAAAEQEFQRALSINPNYATAHHWYHECLTAMGRFDEQMAEILLAQELDPLSLIINTDVAWGLYYGRAYDEAIDQLHRTLEFDANFAVAHLMLGFAYAQKRALTEALSHAQRAIDLSGEHPSTLAVAALGYIQALNGRRIDAVTVVERLAHLPRARYAADYCQAVVFAGLGECDTACQRLERAIAERYDRLIYLNVEPIFDSVRGEHRFQKLVELIGLPSRTKSDGRRTRDSKSART
jgi:DNA-binding SARP family transcriptional activator/Flp pilus assembly protein TadD